MLSRFGKEKPSVLDEPIASILTKMKKTDPNSPEYQVLLKHLSKLIKLKEGSNRRPISSDAMLTVAGNLLGILIIVAYEQKHAMVSKGLGFVIKAK